MVYDSFLTVPRLYIHPRPSSPRPHLRPLYIAVVFISVHKFEGSYTHAPSRAHLKYISSDRNIYETHVTPRLNNRTFSLRQKELDKLKTRSLNNEQKGETVEHLYGLQCNCSKRHRFVKIKASLVNVTSVKHSAKVEAGN